MARRIYPVAERVFGVKGSSRSLASSLNGFDPLDVIHVHCVATFQRVAKIMDCFLKKYLLAEVVHPAVLSRILRSWNHRCRSRHPADPS